MPTEVVQIDPASFDETVVQRAVDVLAGGGLVAFPTETVYGVGTRADRPSAVERLRALKSRASNRAFTVHIGSPDFAAHFVPQISGTARSLIRKAWPGPLTLIVDVADPSAAPAMAGLNGSARNSIYYNNTVGLRCPDDRVAQALLRAAGAPVVAASANRAGNPPPHSADAVLKDLGGQVDLLIDAGTTRYAAPSTIVRIQGRRTSVVREGILDARTVKRLSTLRLLFVCTGNTCRSPMAEALTSKIIAERIGCDPSDLAAEGIELCSAGTSGGSGGASPNAVSVMARRGLDISGHTSTALSVERVQQADYIYAMTRSHRDRVIELVPSAADRVWTLLDNEDVNDPAGGSEQEYHDCADLIDKGLRARLEELRL